MLELLGSDERPFAKLKAQDKQQDNKGPNLWEKDDWKPVAINLSSFEKTGKSFAISYQFKDNKVLPEVKEKFIELAKALGKLGYVFRYDGGKDDDVDNAILNIEGLSVETYIPWAKFNPDIKTPTLSKPTEKAYGVAAGAHKIFNKLKPAIRTILAKKVHTMLGTELTNPLTVMITYSECGSEVLTKKMDYKVTGNVVFYLKVCEDSNISVFNIKNTDAVKRLIEYLKTYE